jgi:hypothetical protein
MSGTKQTIEITTMGVDNPTLVQPQDSVQWLAVNEANVVGGVRSATITFTGSQPFTKSLGGTVSLSGGQESSTYTVSNEAKSGKYAYKVVVDGGAYTFECDIQVVPGDAVIVSSGPAE